MASVELTAIQVIAQISARLARALDDARTFAPVHANIVPAVAFGRLPDGNFADPRPYPAKAQPAAS